jgi:hypothetical protein
MAGFVARRAPALGERPFQFRTRRGHGVTGFFPPRLRAALTDWHMQRVFQGPPSRRTRVASRMSWSSDVAA